MCLEGGNVWGDVHRDNSTLSQGRAAGISLLTSPGRVWRNGALFFLFVNHVLNSFGQ
jgi:hypothetical protein